MSYLWDVWGHQTIHRSRNLTKKSFEHQHPSRPRCWLSSYRWCRGASPPSPRPCPSHGDPALNRDKSVWTEHWVSLTLTWAWRGQGCGAPGLLPVQQRRGVVISTWVMGGGARPAPVHAVSGYRGGAAVADLDRVHGLLWALIGWVPSPRPLIGQLRLLLGARAQGAGRGRGVAVVRLLARRGYF